MTFASMAHRLAVLPMVGIRFCWWAITFAAARK